ncbi:aminopeptidase P family protein [Asaia siamensis]|uniref:Xaa-Pro aminopeptidase n=1 Tax=Asaia siamensis TaxID=110479 RepID=A0ABQ1MGC8_9PROT|nr:aminopeptidase P family protein [Asaia siamensis]GBR06676.1 Xaa-Pro aminopeptidase [Asaia siamensis NRIC 0323]GGC40086.1 Xaa-Pro aminopeptidase [Asaia siamensis]
MSLIPLANRQALVRKALEASHVDGFFLPRGDEFMGEYVAPYAERLAWLTGFTGSAGMAILLRDKAAVFSDGRYTSQLRDQVDASQWECLHVTNEPPGPWLAANGKGLRIGYDPRLVSEVQLNALIGDGHEFVALDANPIDAAWSDKPLPPESEVRFQEEAFSGEDSLSKRRKIGGALRKAGQEAMLVCDPTSLAWLLNIRGDDVPHTPVVLAFGILHHDASLEVFVDISRVSPDAAVSFLAVSILPPQDLPERLKALSGQVVRFDPAQTGLWFIQTLSQAGAKLARGVDLCALPRACKNETEQSGARKVHLTDSTALCRFLHFVSREGTGLRETRLAEILNDFRAASPDYHGESFPAISAVGPNAALPHYRALPGEDRVLEANQVYLIDSGGQYSAGTTDVTRTIWNGPEAPPAALCEAFTRVLKGNIALARARFPAGTTGHRLDALARYALWQAGLDYDHGTGHGIGSYLSVHEGPQNISSVARPIGLEAGMILSDEPGYYLPGEYGIRLENLLLVRPAPVKARTAFLEFEVLGFAPFDRTLIMASLLEPEELRWLNAYHEDTLARIGPLLDETDRTWLAAACAPITN